MNTKKDTLKKEGADTLAPKKVEKSNLTIEQKNDAQKVVEEIFKGVSTPTPEQRLSNLKVLNELSKKVEILRQTKEDFNLFCASYDSTSGKLTLENAQGYKFSVSNSLTLAKVFDVIGKDLGDVTLKAETEFLNFSI